MKRPPLAELRRAAPGSITQEDVVDRMKAFGVVRTQAWVSGFEKDLYDDVPEDAERAYAKAIGASLAAVRRARKATRPKKTRK